MKIIIMVFNSISMEEIAKHFSPFPLSPLLTRISKLFSDFISWSRMIFSLIKGYKTLSLICIGSEQVTKVTILSMLNV